MYILIIFIAVAALILITWELIRFFLFRDLLGDGFILYEPQLPKFKHAIEMMLKYMAEGNFNAVLATRHPNYTLTHFSRNRDAPGFYRVNSNYLPQRGNHTIIDFQTSGDTAWVIIYSQPSLSSPAWYSLGFWQRYPKEWLLVRETVWCEIQNPPEQT